MINIKKLLTKILSYTRVDALYAPASELHPTEEGWYPGYTSVANLENYNLIYVRVHVYGVYRLIAFPRLPGATSYSQTVTDAFNSGGNWTYGRMLVEVDWDSNEIGISTVNGAMSEMGVTNVWGTNKLR